MTTPADVDHVPATAPPTNRSRTHTVEPGARWDATCTRCPWVKSYATRDLCYAAGAEHMAECPGR